MPWPRLIPSSELLSQLSGVETGLRKRRAFGRFGAWLAIAAAAVQATTIVAESEYWKALREFKWAELRHDWQFWALGLAIAAGVLAFTWSRYWLRASQQPFRYTCFIDGFAVATASSNVKNLAWLPHDLVTRLSSRVARLSFTPTAAPPEAAPGAAADGDAAAREADVAHFVVAGSYVVRDARRTGRTLEITPTVRLGSPNAPAVSLEPIREALPAGGGDAGGDIELSADAYDALCERVYFAVGSEIYRQIRASVRRRIALLPTRYHQASALLHEAADQAAANTLDALDEASELFREAREYGDACTRRLPQRGVRRAIGRAWRRLHRMLRGLRRWGARFAPSLMTAEMMRLRIDIGLAITVAERRFIAAASAQPLANKIFLARRLAASAVQRLADCPADVPGRRKLLFDAHIALAFALANLDDPLGASAELEAAERLDPMWASEDARFYLLQGYNEARLAHQIALLRRASDLRPRHELSRFLLALALEKQWRIAGLSDGADVQQVLDEYETVVATNPGLVGAWANQGYIRWLVGGATGDDKLIARSRQDFEMVLNSARGRQPVFTGELHHGLTRLAAERGDFAEALLHVRRTADAQMAVALSSLASDYTSYYYEHAGRVLVDRFAHYATAVGTELQRTRLGDVAAASGALAFALDDAAAAFDAYAARTGDVRYVERARAARQQAEQLDPHNVVIRLHAASARIGYLRTAALEPEALQARFEAELRTLAELVAARPEWFEARAVQLRIRSEFAAWLQAREAQLRAVADAKEQEAREARRNAGAAARAATQDGLPTLTGRAPPDAADVGAHSLFESPWARGARAGRPELEPVSRRAASAQRDSENARRAAHDAGNQLAKLIDQICVPPRREVPHAWLWHRDLPELRGDAFGAGAFQGELRWEIDFTEQHAHAFKSWIVQCDRWDEPPKQIGRRRWLRRTAVTLAELRDHISRVFWPSAVERELAFMGARRYERGARDSVEFVRDWVRRGRASDPTDLRVLEQDWRLGNEGPADGRDDAEPAGVRPARLAEVHVRLADAIPLLREQPYVAKWIADRLRDARGQAAATRGALGCALESAGNDVDLILEIAGFAASLDAELLHQAMRDLQAVAKLIGGEASPASTIRAAVTLLRYGHPDDAQRLMQHVAEKRSPRELADGLSAAIAVLEPVRGGDAAAGAPAPVIEPVHARPFLDWLDDRVTAARGHDPAGATALTVSASRFARFAAGAAASDAPSSPLRIVFDAGLIGDAGQRVIDLYEEHSEALRARMGVGLPRGVDAITVGHRRENRYVINVGAGRVDGAVPGPDHRFHDRAGRDGSVFDPWTGASDGAWRPPTVRGGKTALEYILRHALREAERHVDALLTYDGMCREVDERVVPGLPRGGAAGELIAERPRLFRVLRRLLGEGVPVIDLTRLSGAFLTHARSCGDEVLLTELMRLSVRGTLPGRGATEVLQLTDGFEAAIRRQLRSASLLVAPAAEIRGWRKAIAAGLAGADPASSAMVVAPEIRYQVRRLAGRAPVPVLSTRECAWGQRDSPTRRIALS